MTKVQIIERALPELTTPSDDWLDWAGVQANKGKLSPYIWARLLFRPWLYVCAPKGTPCAIRNMGGDPLYVYKRFNDKAYLLRMAPSPGFPGS